MKLSRIHAYSVAPQRLVPNSIQPPGGAFNADDSFEAMLDRYLRKADLPNQPPVDFQVSPNSRRAGTASHEVRTLLLDYIFGQPATAKKAAVELAQRLGNSMDERSSHSLLVLSAYLDGKRGRIVIWAFPKDEPIQFSASKDRAKLKVVKDAFSQSSAYRKAALFEGQNAPLDFWSGRVIDRQAQSGKNSAADYWVTEFMGCRFSVTGSAGTKLLAKFLTDTHASLATQSDRDLVSQAVLGLNASQRPKWSMQEVANDFLADGAKQTFLEKVPSGILNTKFTLDYAEFARKIRLRIFKLDNHVVVQAPFEEVGNSVKVSGTGQRRLTCSGKIVDESVK